MHMQLWESVYKNSNQPYLLGLGSEIPFFSLSVSPLQYNKKEMLPTLIWLTKHLNLESGSK